MTYTPTYLLQKRDTPTYREWAASPPGGRAPLNTLTGRGVGVYPGPMSPLPSSYTHPHKKPRRIPDLEPEISRDVAGRPILRFIPETDPDGPRTVLHLDESHMEAIRSFMVDEDDPALPVQATSSSPEHTRNGKGEGSTGTRIIPIEGYPGVSRYQYLSRLFLDDEGYLYVDFDNGTGAPPATFKIDSYLWDELAAALGWG